MARKLYYKVIDDGLNILRSDEWEDIQRLQHWYNSEFIWSGGKLALKMFAIFPNMESGWFENEEQLHARIRERQEALRANHTPENDILLQLERDGLIILKKGGYIDGCLASGFTRVAANEFNAYLVCEFLLKASLVSRDATFTIHDEGEFIKPGTVQFRAGSATVSVQHHHNPLLCDRMVSNRHVFSVVDAEKYERYPRFRPTISDFNDLPKDEQEIILRDWNWLGFENNFDVNGDDVQGFDLNKKVSSFRVEDQEHS